MVRTSTVIFSAALLCVTMSFASFAAEEVDKPVKEIEAVSMPPNPHIEELSAYALKLVEDLKEDDLRVLYEIRNSFGITRSIRTAHGDVENAVKLCGKENKDLKKEMNERFSKWDKAIMASVEATEERTEAMIKKQTVRPVADVEKYLDLTKKAADFSDDQIEKRPVTTEEACRSLLTSMDNTQDVLTGLLDQIELGALEKKEEKKSKGEAEESVEEEKAVEAEPEVKAEKAEAEEEKAEEKAEEEAEE